jgi:uncharacterized membrane protein
MKKMKNEKLESRSPQTEVTATPRIENAMGNLLRIGVLSAAAVVLLGGVLFLWQHGRGGVDYHEFTGETSAFRGLTEIIPAALALDPPAVIQFGMLLLIATPVARVLFALVMFLRERDRNFVLITLLVLGVLLYGFLGGKV